MEEKTSLSEKIVLMIAFILYALSGIARSISGGTKIRSGEMHEYEEY